MPQKHCIGFSHLAQETVDTYLNCRKRKVVSVLYRAKFFGLGEVYATRVDFLDLIQVLLGFIFSRDMRYIAFKV